MRRSIISKFIVLTSCHKVLSVISSTLFGLPWNTSSPYRDINVSCNIYKYVKKTYNIIQLLIHTILSENIPSLSPRNFQLNPQT